MAADSNIGFGDNVRVRTTPETEALGVAGLAGQVFGWTTPSVTGVAVVGGLENDYAINVNFEGRGQQLWFATELLEFIDHAPGTTMQTGRVLLTRDVDGSWFESRKKRWWQFWR